MVVRRVNEKDREEFIRLSELFYHSPAVMHPVPKGYHAALFDEAMRSDAYTEVFLLEEEGSAMGFGVIAKTFSREAGGMVMWLEELFLCENCRGRGYGRKFFDFIEKYAREKDFKRIRLEVEPENTRAQALYERLGYQHLPYLQMVKEEGQF